MFLGQAARKVCPRVGCDKFHRCVPKQLAEREAVRRRVARPQGSLSSQAIEQLTISGLSRQGQPEPENLQRLRAPTAWQDIQTQVEHISPQSTINSHHNRWALALRRQARNARVAEARLTREVSVGTETRRARLAAHEDTWQRCAAETH